MSLRNKVLFFSVSFCMFILIFTAIFIFYNNNKQKEFISLINSIDNSLIEDTDSTELFYKAVNAASNQSQFKMILKRLVQSENITILNDILKISYKKYPKDPEILNVYLYTLTKLNLNNEINYILSKVDTSSIHENIYLEALLSTDKPVPPDSKLYGGLGKSNIALYKNLYTRTKNSNFLINAGLLYLEKNDLINANTTLRSIDKNSLLLSKLLLITEYKNKNYDTVLEMLSLNDFGFSIEELQLFQIDIQVQKNLYGKAINSLISFINIHPEYSENIYNNLIWLNSFEPQYNIETYIDNSNSFFPLNQELILSIAAYYKKYNREKDALVLIKRYLLSVPEDLKVEIIYRQFLGINNPDSIVNNTRKLVNLDPLSPKSVNYLLWYLYTNNNINYLESFLTDISSSENNSNILFYEGLINANRSNFTLATEKLESSYVLKNNWETLYNLAVISELNKEFNSAIEYYQRSENSISDLQNNYSTKSLIRTSLASLFYQIGDSMKAIRELNIAIDQNPENLKAILLLKKLESTLYK
jgi:hypothetical protein